MTTDQNPEIPEIPVTTRTPPVAQIPYMPQAPREPILSDQTVWAITERDRMNAHTLVGSLEYIAARVATGDAGHAALSKALERSREVITLLTEAAGHYRPQG